MGKDATVSARIDENVEALVNKPGTLEELSQDELNEILQHSYQQAIARQGKPLNTVFADLERKHP